jgi:hypothetical protein
MPFIAGVNLPWIRYGGDFGANAWRPEGGLAASADDRARAERALKEIAAAGGTVVRWFLLCDGRAGLRTDHRGEPAGLDERVLHDIDAALALASDANIQLMFVLFDFHWCLRHRRINGVDLGGRRRALADESARRRLLDHVVSPIVSRFGMHDSVWAWDIINEPEWVTRGTGTVNPLRGVSAGALRAFLGDTLEFMRTTTRQPVTVGLASARGLRLVRDLPLDFYQVHWYDALDRRAPLDCPVSAFDLSAPVLLGEFPTRGSRRSPCDIARLARRHGYCGAFPWSWMAEDAATDPVQVRAAISALGSRLWAEP